MCTFSSHTMLACTKLVVVVATRRRYKKAKKCTLYRSCSDHTLYWVQYIHHAISFLWKEMIDGSINNSIIFCERGQIIIRQSFIPPFQLWKTLLRTYAPTSDSKQSNQQASKLAVNKQSTHTTRNTNQPPSVATPSHQQTTTKRHRNECIKINHGSINRWKK